jgi:hypothetical protein
MAIFKVKRKPSYAVIDAYRNYKDWMFLDNDFTHIEILPPTLENLEMMQEFGLTYVIKGFRNIVEYSRWDHLRFKFGISSLFLATRCLGNQFMSDAIVSFFNSEPLPNSGEIAQEIENNRLLPITNPKEEKRIIEREYYLREYRKYSIIIHRELVKLIKQNRLERLSIVQ